MRKEGIATTHEYVFSHITQAHPVVGHWIAHPGRACTSDFLQSQHSIGNGFRPDRQSCVLLGSIPSFVHYSERRVSVRSCVHRGVDCTAISGTDPCDTESATTTQRTPVSTPNTTPRALGTTRTAAHAQTSSCNSASSMP